MKRKPEILIRIKKAIKEIEPRADVVLYGSRARGDEKQESDWDLLILVPYPAGIKEEQKFRHKLFELELEFGQAISTLVKSKKEWETRFRVTPLYENILKEGIKV
ncbi:MAG TPA: nucleotidyltransferase domain-containing protein [Phaeodactylibacter sp.]|nr:nucleotidyltransferase domain-containing protein [Phaeodactylibacter sp.]